MSRWLLVRWGSFTLGLVATGLAVACGTAGSFICEADADCSPNGFCEGTGYCSFPDANCSSGRRYGSLAGGGFADLCVEPTTSTGSSTGAATSGGSVDSTSTATPTSSSTATLTTGGDVTGSTTAVATNGSSTSSGATTTTGSELPMGLILYMSFEEDFSEVSGAMDASGNALHATCEDGVCPSSTAGVRGNAASFGPTPTRLVVPYDPLLDFDEAFTIAAWMRIEEIADSGLDVAVARPVGTMSRNSYEVLLGPGDGAGREIRFNVGDADATFGLSAPSPFIPMMWHHVAAVWDGASTTIFFDGEAVATRVVDPPDYDGSDLIIGIDNDAGMFQNDWEGAIDELQIYDRALSEEEIAELVD